MSQARRPNILIVMTDHQRGDTALPEHPAITPHLSALAAEGLTFSETFCPTPHCCPARATFFSGLYPSRHGVWNNICNEQALSRGLKPGTRLWSEDLAQAGYRMLYTGKWHVSVEEGPQDRGWEVLRASGVAGDQHGPRWEHYRHLASQPRPTSRDEGQILRPGYGDYRLYRTTDQADPASHDEKVTRDAVAALADLGSSDQPWCLYVGLTGPHDPYNVPREFVDLYDLDDVPLPPSYVDALEDKPRIYQRMRRMAFGQLTEREVREGIRHFWAFCSYLDSLFGRVLAALEATGQADDTLVLFTADHGDYCGEHGLFCKGIPCFRGAYHVPGIVRWPAGLAKPGRREDAFVSLADFGPTFVQLAGGQPDPGLTGQSLMPFLQDQRPANWRDEIHTQCNGVELYYTQRSVTTRQYKYTFNGFDEDELYDLAHDPHEMVNLAADPAYADIKRDLLGRMWRFAHREQDGAINSYITVGLAPHGPAEAFGSEP